MFMATPKLMNTSLYFYVGKTLLKEEKIKFSWRDLDHTLDTKKIFNSVPFNDHIIEISIGGYLVVLAEV